ncbi:MAG TPA: hypothetical protein PLZ93_06690 [Nocardioides sp.]|mgnify:CR=1 FL=1|uniref:hypothetical protein n=1 Tax=uncultured Nocardioides sp. TaxID=198441 RepID=UPI000EB9B9F5|nr:hypothetical protein [uncultured Nocardioides sp.]HCB06388.1 hypothetical protein [Nocardioides sp.]HRD59869.1 hypothetical protein [Nocardioides sp.]HRI95280.1 hypothetical protein [Nocardioides sp.]HRK45147.1 hypothetical protein [Nocardioides sp.]
MENELRFRKAVLQADRDGAQAEMTLRSLLSHLDASPLRIRTLVFLGDLVMARGDGHAARPLLEEATGLAKVLDPDQVLAHETRLACELLATL